MLREEAIGTGFQRLDLHGVSAYKLHPSSDWRAFGYVLPKFGGILGKHFQAAGGRLTVGLS